MLDAGNVGGETPRLEGELSEKEGAEECGGVREPSEEGENIAELDIRAGGEPSHDELRSAPPGGSNSQRIIFQQKKTSNLISKSLKLILCKPRLGQR